MTDIDQLISTGPAADSANGTQTTPIGVGMLGNGFMAKAHTKALIDARALGGDLPATQLVSVSGRDEAALRATRDRYGWLEHTTDWREQVADPRIALIHNTGPNGLHVEPTLAALAAGKHVLCEKPLASTAEEAHVMWRAAEASGRVHLCGFNFRFAPAARLLRDMVHAGEIGEVIHVRAQFLESYGLDGRSLGWRDNAADAGSGAVADLGCHIIDLMRWVAGDPTSVQALTTTVGEGVPAEIDDAFAALVELPSGASGVLESSRVAGGYASRCSIEVDGTRGSLRFTTERLNELEHAARDRVTRTIRVTGAGHPYMELWWPSPGHAIGWGDTFTHEVRHLLGAIAGDHAVAPLGADFGDGYRCAEICDAILRSARSHGREPIAYRSLDAAA